MTNYRPSFLVLGLLAAAPALCAPTPQSYIDGTPQTKTDPRLYPAHIVAIDGDSPRTKPVAVTPGPHWLEIEAPGAGKGPPKTQTFVLKIEPCTYYYVGMRRDPVVQDKWKLVVDEEDTLKECDPVAELKKAREVQPTAAPKVHTPQ